MAPGIACTLLCTGHGTSPTLHLYYWMLRQKIEALLIKVGRNFSTFKINAFVWNPPWNSDILLISQETVTISFLQVNVYELILIHVISDIRLSWKNNTTNLCILFFKRLKITWIWIQSLWHHGCFRLTSTQLLNVSFSSQVLNGRKVRKIN